MGEYFTLFMGAVIVNNFVLTRFLGLCIFFGVSKNLNASIGMGMAVTSVMTLSSILAWAVYTYVLHPFHLTFLTTIVFVVLIASFVQLTEMIIKKHAPARINAIPKPFRDLGTSAYCSFSRKLAINIIAKANPAPEPIACTTLLAKVKFDSAFNSGTPSTMQLVAISTR